MTSQWMWIIAGPNGAGKSSFSSDFLIALGQQNLQKLNADEETLRLRQQFPDSAVAELNLRAAQLIDARVVDCITKRQSFLLETVLSSDKYRDDVLSAKTAGMKVGLIYVSLFPPELSPQRVALRVAKGGHAVEFATAIKRHARSHEQLRWFAPQADILMVFDNSNTGTNPVLVAKKTKAGRLQLLAPGINPAIDTALADMLSQKPPYKPRKRMPKQSP